MTKEEAIKELSYIADEMPSMECADWKDAISTAIKALEQEPRKGHWMINKEKNLAKCSNCKFFLKDKDEIKLLGTFIQGYNYCPYCGAYMGEDKE